MSHSRFFTLRRKIIVVCPLFLLLFGAIAQTASFGQATNAERRHTLVRFRHQNPPVEIRRVSNLQNEHFLRDLEVEVKNISSRPIYHISLGVRFPALPILNSHYGFPLGYGRPQMVDLRQRATPEDTPLLPGETHVLTVPELIWRGFEHYVRTNDVPAEATRNVEFRFETISFGDGTGFSGNGTFEDNRARNGASANK